MYNIHTHLLELILLPPANEVCEGYVFTGVCLSTGRGVSAPLHAGIHTPRADTPQADTPRQTPPLAGTPAQCMLGYGQQAGSTHPTGMHVEPFLKSFKPSTSDLSHFTIDSTLWLLRYQNSNQGHFYRPQTKFGAR